MLDTKTARSEDLGLRRSQRTIRPLASIGGRVAGHRCNWCTRTATAAPKLRRTQLSSACRTPGTPSGPDGAWPSFFPLPWHSSSAEILKLADKNLVGFTLLPAFLTS
jgi:hypothetical protein